MKELRCLYCGKLLCKIEGNYKIEIKCNKCKNIMDVTECREKKEHQPE